MVFYESEYFRCLLKVSRVIFILLQLVISLDLMSYMFIHAVIYERISLVFKTGEKWGHREGVRKGKRKEGERREKGGMEERRK
jgi:hypothetical protein